MRSHAFRRKGRLDVAKPEDLGLYSPICTGLEEIFFNLVEAGDVDDMRSSFQAREAK